jgi:glycosyltransferase involved in cell wall biosynthesis
MIKKIISRIQEVINPDPMPDIGPILSDKTRVLYIVTKYPEFSETYMHDEMVAMNDDYEIRIIDYEKSSASRENSLPHTFIKYHDSNLSYGSFKNINTEFTNRAQIKFMEKMGHVIKQFKPDIIHTHYFPNAWLVRKLSDLYKLPFTVRIHSFDIMIKNRDRLASMMDAVNTPLCLKVFTYPEFVPLFSEFGIDKTKVEAYWPISNCRNFLNTESRNPTNRVMCAGPCTPKKSHDKFIDLAVIMSDSKYDFDLYTIGNATPKMVKYNESKGNPIIITYVDPERMPEEYCKHDWLVYPSDPNINKVGLPVAVIEAQASGIGICLQELPGRRQAQLDFLGGGGFLFKSIEEVPDILAKPYPEEMRLAGFENVKKCDVSIHKEMLSRVWDTVA